ncbi:Rad9/Ddc1 [Kalmanozyma brasiliensis GHG001]|uniref:DNA repair protein rad9 n=1 Tax=Kalmanozyma brasiliensis (strain GHG001) TaxID=1365824 RepID=V5EU04_KALBG|nr:Rad9/Ddc1 [Kalmanozyma brasiliensis GHG001]EST08825.1 Rad9/Ddc1 [Kalmanozyma brasiliensis GHG001]
MNALISAHDIKTFYSTLHCLSRFSDSFWLSCTPRPSSAPSLRLSAINPTNSAFCLFAFDPDFFLALNCTEKLEVQIQLKGLLSILRSRGRTVERLELRLTTDTICRLSITLHCRHGIVKTHHLTYEPKRGLLPTADPNPANFFCLNPNTAGEWLDHFLSSSKTGEITLLCTPTSCVARSKDEELPEGKGMVRKSIATEVKIAIDEFKEYGVLEEARLTLSLREFKATVQLAESLGVSVEVNFSDGDEPLFVRLRVESAVAAEFVIATTKAGAATGGGSGEGSAGGGGGEAQERTRIAASVSSSARTNSHSGPSASHHQAAETSSSSSSSLPSHHAPVPTRIPNQSTPLPPVPQEEDEDETQPLFFPGASQLSLQPTPPVAVEDFVQPTPVAMGGDPGEWLDPHQPSAPPPPQQQQRGTDADDADEDEESDSERDSASAPRKRFRPLF